MSCLPLSATAAAGTAGVVGENTASGTGVYGHTNGIAQAGVKGVNDGTGPGVFGQSNGGSCIGGVDTFSGGGIGVLGSSQYGTGVLANQAGPTAKALDVRGTATFSRSGIVAIASPAKTATVTGVALTASSLVLATVQNSVGVFVQSAVPNVAGSRFTVHLNKAPATGITASVAWFVVN